MDDFLKSHLRCPDCHGSFDMQSGSYSIRCERCGMGFPMVDNIPILLSSHNDVFPQKELLNAIRARGNASKKWIQKVMPSICVNLACNSMLEKFGRLLSQKTTTCHVLVVGSGTQKTWLDGKFANIANVELVYCDVDAASIVDCYCDAHELPFVDASFEGVIATAVLEHVLYPERISAEINRVLKAGGLLYSELPFMQQVHEGAYDFTRYTLSGHRRLFNSFTEIEVGMVAGPGTALAWSLENYFLAFFTSVWLRRALKVILRFAFFWIKYSDYYLEDKPQAMDGASCTFFFGQKGNKVNVSDKQIVNKYIGANTASFI